MCNFKAKKNKIEAQSAMWKSIVLNMCHRLELEESWKKLERESEKKNWLIDWNRFGFGIGTFSWIEWEF